MTAVHVLGISGSLRRDSFNTSLLRAAGTLVPEGMALTVQLLHDIPLYNGDVEAAGLPAGVVALREAIRTADGVLIATPEYNNSMPGVLKNAIDWVSRGKDQPQAVLRELAARRHCRTMSRRLSSAASRRTNHR